MSIQRKEQKWMYLLRFLSAVPIIQVVQSLLRHGVHIFCHIYLTVFSTKRNTVFFLFSAGFTSSGMCFSGPAFRTLRDFGAPNALSFHFRRSEDIMEETTNGG